MIAATDTETRGYELTNVGIVFHRRLADDEYLALGRKVARLATAAAWAIGDWLVAGVGRGPMGNSYHYAAEITGRSFDSLSQYSRVSLAFPGDRDPAVPWSLYRELLRLPTKDRLPTLRLIQQNEWTRRSLTEYVDKRLEHPNIESTPDLPQRRTGARQWRRPGAPKRDVRCPNCGHVFDVRRKGLTDRPIEARRAAADAYRVRATRLRAAGLCVRCAKEPKLSKSDRCQRCTRYAAEAQRKYDAAKRARRTR